MGKNKGKGLAHRVGLARARAGMLAQLEWNIISYHCTLIVAIFLRLLKDACNTTRILSLGRSNHIVIHYSEVEMCLCAVTVQVNSFREGCSSSSQFVASFRAMLVVRLVLFHWL